MTVIAKVFDFRGSDVRALLIDGKPQFVANDACTILGLANPRSSLALLDEDEKGVHTMDTPGGQQELKTVTEPGLYSLIFRSRRPEAKDFKRWVTHEVLPAIRETGKYEVANQNHPAVPQSFADALRLAADLQEENERQARALESAAPKVAYVDTFLRNSDSCLMRQLAKRIGYTERELRDELMRRRIIFRTPVSRYSESKGREVIEYRYEAATSHMAWFREGDQPRAPRLHNDQMRTTLYVTPAGKVGIAGLLGRLDVTQLELEGASA